MRTTPAGLALIRSFEGCKLISYRDLSGIWTCGYGCTRGVGPDTVWTQEEADTQFLLQVQIMEDLVLKCLPGIGLNDNQLSALTSFAYNVGFGHKGVKDGLQVLASGQPSTLLKCLLANDFQGAALEFPKWDHVGGQVCAGILRRRQAEAALFEEAA